MYVSHQEEKYMDLNLELYIYITKISHKNYKILFAISLWAHINDGKRKIFTYCMFWIQTKQNKLTGIIQDTLFHMVSKHFIVIILEHLVGIIKVHLRSLRVKNGKKEKGQSRGWGINVNIEDDLMEEPLLTFEILFLYSPEQCK